MQLCNCKVPLGYIPAGTTNDFATSLGIPKDILEAAETAVNGTVFPCDVGMFGEDYLHTSQRSDCLRTCLMPRIRM